jgi:hypothetical protein
MSKLKVGNKVEITGRTSGYVGIFKIGGTAEIKEFNPTTGKYVRLVGDNSSSCNWHHIDKIKLVKTKWTIYNNTLPWSELSDKQKGKMLLARHCDNLFVSDFSDVAFCPKFIDSIEIIKAVKPESTMEELFIADINSMPLCGYVKAANYMIAKGWVKNARTKR